MDPSQNYFSTPSANADIYPENRLLLQNHQIHQPSTNRHPSIQYPFNQQLSSECNFSQILSSYDHNQQNYIDSGEQSTSEDVQRTEFVASAITQEKLVSENLSNYQMQQPTDHYPSMRCSVNQQPLSEYNRNQHPIYRQKFSAQIPNYCDKNPKNFYTTEQFNHQSASQVQQTTATPMTTEEKVKRHRTTYTDFQLNYLEQCFQTNQYLKGVEQKKEIALALNLKEQQVKKWFQNRRMREKYNVEPQPSNNQNEQVNYVNDENEHFNLEELNAQATAGSALINQNENTYYGNNSSYWNQENIHNYRYEPSTFRNEQFVPGTGQHNMYQGFNNMQENTDFRQYQNTDNNSYGNFPPYQDVYAQNINFLRTFTPVQNYSQNQFYYNRPQTNESLNQNAVTASPSVGYPTQLQVLENHTTISNNYYNNP